MSTATGVRDVTLDDFTTGLMAGLAKLGVTVVSIRGRQFYSAIARVFDALRDSQDERGLDIRFRIRLNPVYGDSADVREAITRAVQRDIISLDNPVYQDMRLKIGTSDADLYLEELPGGKELYVELARLFMSEYRATV